MTKEDMLNKFANITTYEGNKYKIRTKNYYIHDRRMHGKLYVISAKKSNNQDVHILKNIYSLDNNRLRFLCDIYRNAETFDTIEKDIDGSEHKITVISKYTSVNEKIMSIGNIKAFVSDKVDSTNKKGDNILKLKPLKKIKRIDL